MVKYLLIRYLFPNIVFHDPSLGKRIGLRLTEFGIIACRGFIDILALQQRQLLADIRKGRSHQSLSIPVDMLQG